MVSADKLPPFDVEAEEAVIASILVDEDAIARVESIVQSEHFYRDQNRWAFEACLELWSRNETINQLTLGHELSRRGKLDDVGGQPYLSRIVGDLPTPIGVEHYAGIVRRDFMYRSMITVGSQIVQVAYQGGPDLEGAITRAENLVMELRTSHRSGDLVPLRQYLDEFWESQGIDSPFAGTIGAVRSGFMDLDQLLGGFHRSDLIVCAARPSVGKSSLLLNFARNAAVGHNARIAIFTIEMKGEQIVERLLASESGVDGTRIRLHQHNDTDEQRLMQATGILHGLEIYIDDSSIVTVAVM
jgi:replicative DNA helicase